MDLDQKGIIRDLNNIWINTEEKKNYLDFMLHFYRLKRKDTKFLKIQNNEINIFTGLWDDIVNSPRNRSIYNLKKGDDSYLQKYKSEDFAALYRSHDDFEKLEEIRIETKPKNDFNYFRGKFTDDDDEEKCYIDFFNSVILINYMKTKFRENKKYMGRDNKVRKDLMNECEKIKKNSGIYNLLDIYLDRGGYVFTESGISSEEWKKFYKLFKLGLPI